MKRVLLSGGATSHEFLWRAIVESLLLKEIRICVIPHAQIKENWRWPDTRWVEYIFRSNFPHSKDKFRFNHISGFTSKEEFEALTMEANIIFVPGGDGDILQDELDAQFGEELIKDVFDKTKADYVGVSAGSNYLSEYYYSNDNTSINRGIGLIKTATFCHYKEHKFNELTALASLAIEFGLKLIPIGDFDYVEFRYDNMK